MSCEFLTPERRTLPSASVSIEIREDEKRRIVGYASVFYRANDPGTEYQLWDDIYERIAPGAFDRAIKEGDDVRALFNHDVSLVLGRRSAGTVEITSDKRGLRYEIDPPDTQTARDLMTSIERGDINGSSFAFFVQKASWSEEEDRDIRTIEAVELLDVGPVTFPAYESTTSGLRMRSAGVQREYDEWLAHKEAKRKRGERISKLRYYRARLAEIT